MAKMGVRTTFDHQKNAPGPGKGRKSIFAKGRFLFIVELTKDLIKYPANIDMYTETLFLERK